MSAELEIVGGRAQMMYATRNGLPWHGDGTAVEDDVAPREALEIAGLGWTVGLEPVFDANGNIIDRYRGVTRSSDNKVLGMVKATGNYTEIQNYELADFLQAVMDSADRPARVDTAASLFGGSQVFMTIELEDDMRIGDDDYRRFLLASTSHDGTRAFRVDNTDIRVVCNNTLSMALSVPALARVKHNANKDVNMAAALQTVRVSTAASRRMSEWLNRLNDREVTPTEIRLFRDNVFGAFDAATPAQRQTAIETWTSIFAQEKDRVGRTGYALVNSVTGYGDHAIRFDTEPGARFASIMKGRASIFKRDALKEVEKVTGIFLDRSAYDLSASAS